MSLGVAFLVSGLNLQFLTFKCHTSPWPDPFMNEGIQIEVLQC